MDKNKCHTKGVFNRSQLIGVLEILDEVNFQGVLGIADVDYDYLEKNLPKSKNLILTDLHDIEAMILQSPALEKFLTEYLDDKKLKKFILNHKKWFLCPSHHPDTLN